MDKTQEYILKLEEKIQKLEIENKRLTIENEVLLSQILNVNFKNNSNTSDLFKVDEIVIATYSLNSNEFRAFFSAFNFKNIVYRYEKYPDFYDDAVGSHLTELHNKNLVGLLNTDGKSEKEFIDNSCNYYQSNIIIYDYIPLSQVLNLMDNSLYLRDKFVSLEVINKAIEFTENELYYLFGGPFCPRKILK